MKRRTLFILLPVLGAVMAGLLAWKTENTPRIQAATYLKEKPIAFCGSAFTFLWSDTSFTRPAIIPGLGNLRYPVTTTSLKAQEYFDQGLRLIYAFNHWEAVRSFQEAVRLDPEFAMGYWGLALAFGPNINDWNPADRERLAFESIGKAKSKTARISAVEKDLIQALARRFDGMAHANRDSLNNAYAESMEAVAAKYPNEVEVMVLAADAIMNAMPWNYWNKDGSPKPATSRARQLLERALKQAPQHPGAHHLYIHLVEASAKPEDALGSARFLEDAMPGAGHIVHMPSHIYVRTGQYHRSLEINIRATKADEDYLSSSGNQGMYRSGYYPHNIDFICYSAYMEGKSGVGIPNALKLAYKGNFIAESLPGFYQYFTIEPMVAYVRFGKWNDILSLPEPEDKLLYAKLIYRFSRGLALLRKGYTAHAREELYQLDSLAKLDTLNQMMVTFNTVSSSAQVALHILRGEMLLKENKYSDAINHFKKAVRAEDDMTYNEPPDWKLPARHYLGAALIKAGDYKQAEEVYLEDLKRNRENGWSLTGLQQCQSHLGKKSELPETAKRFASAWREADVAITSSVY